jgi:DnaJ-domain-containing protein 1
LNGVHFEEGETLKDPQILMKIMTIWEEVEEAGGQELEALQKENNGSFFSVHNSNYAILNHNSSTDRINQCVQSLSQHFREGNLDDVKNTTMELQYWSNLKKQLNDRQ